MNKNTVEDMYYMYLKCFKMMDKLPRGQTK